MSIFSPVAAVTAAAGLFYSILTLAYRLQVYLHTDCKSGQIVDDHDVFLDGAQAAAKL